jgi:hypothetical protein
MENTTHARRNARHRITPPVSVSGVLVALGLMLMMAEQPAHAYIDPGSGSLIYQTAIGLLLGFGFMFRRVAAGVTRFFRGRSHADTHAQEDAAADRR